MVLREKTYTVDEFTDWLEARHDDIRFELIEGLIIEMAPPRPINAFIAQKIGMYLGMYDIENKLGYVFGADGGYILSPHDVRIPDVSFIFKERIDSEMLKLVSGAPDLAVEVISPSETVASIHEKTHFYLETGSSVIWVIYPDERIAEIRTASDTGFHIVTVDMDGMLTAETILPDFKLPMRDIFPKAQPQTEA